jgi:hypothetical protein
MERKNGQYGGEVAAILWQSLSPYAVVIGLFCGGLLLGLGVLLRSGAGSGLMPLVLFVVNSLFLLRIALQSAFGSPHAGFFKDDGSNWPEAVAALGRFLFLNLLWLIPAGLLARGVAQDLPARLMTGGVAGAVGPGLALLVLSFALLPPLFLIASVSALSFADLLDREQWRSMFAGRGHDVAALIAVYLGGSLGGMGLAYLFAVALGNGKLNAMVAFGVIAGVYSFGVMLLLLGRLVGGFIRVGVVGVDAGASGPKPRASAADSGSVQIFGLAAGGVSRAVDSALIEAAAAASAASAAATVAASASARPAPRAGSATPPHATMPNPPHAGPRAAAVTPEHALPPKSQLANASVLEVLRANERLARTEPAKALAELDELMAARGRQPQLLARLAALEKQVRPGIALATAREAAQQSCALGSHGAIGDLLEPFADQLDELGLSPEDWLKVAHAQKVLRKLDVATSLYTRLLGLDPGLVPAIKGLVQIADELVRQDAGAEQALAIYDYLDGQCPGHPFREFTDRGREIAERKLLGAR